MSLKPLNSTQKSAVEAVDGPVLIFAGAGSGKTRVLTHKLFYLVNEGLFKPEEILVIHDELDLPAGSVKLKMGGGHGGHNGLRDTIKALNTNNFYRLRIGIGHPGTKNDVVDFVLNAPGNSEMLLIEQGMADAMGVIESLANGDFEEAMKRLHT